MSRTKTTRPSAETPNKKRNARPGGPTSAAAGFARAQAPAAAMQATVGEIFMPRSCLPSRDRVNSGLEQPHTSSRPPDRGGLPWPRLVCRRQGSYVRPSPHGNRQSRGVSMPIPSRTRQSMRTVGRSRGALLQKACCLIHGSLLSCQAGADRRFSQPATPGIAMPPVRMPIRQADAKSQSCPTQAPRYRRFSEESYA